MTELTPEQARTMSYGIFNKIYSTSTRGSEELELCYWNGVITELGGSMDHLDLLPNLVKDGLLSSINSLNDSIAKYAMVSDTTIKFYSIIIKPESERSEEEKEIYEYMKSMVKVTKDLIEEMGGDPDEVN